MRLAVLLLFKLQKAVIKGAQKRGRQRSRMQYEVIGQGIILGQLNQGQIVFANIVIVNKAVLRNDADAETFPNSGIKIVRIAHGIGDFIEITVLFDKRQRKGFSTVAVGKEDDILFFEYFFEGNALITADGCMRAGQYGKFIRLQRYVMQFIGIGQADRIDKG